MGSYIFTGVGIWLISLPGQQPTIGGNTMEGYITVKVMKIPGTSTDVSLNGDRTVGAALAAAKNIIGDTRDHEIRVNGEVVSASPALRGGELIILASRPNGNYGIT